MDKAKLQAYRDWVQSELKTCANFWLEKGMDRVNGGVYTCLDRKGEIYSTDKSVWMQGRCGWTFSYLCHVYGVRPEWLEAAKSCIDFLEDHCINREAGGRMYFTVTAEGKPLRQRRYCFSEGFYVLANAEYYGVTGEREHLERARRAYELIWQLNNGLIKDPTGLGPKTIPETRTGRALADSMIYLNITSVMHRVDPEQAALYDERAAKCADDIFRYHVKPDLKCTLESVDPEGNPPAVLHRGPHRQSRPRYRVRVVFAGVCQPHRQPGAPPGQALEQIFNWAIEAGWDKEYGGLLYFIDCLGKPPEAYEHDMKLWWPHNEIMISSLMLYRDTRDEKYLEWFEKTVAYCKEHFSDPEYGEWYGYLRRDGKPTEPSTKGSTFEGSFHLPRALIQCDIMLGQLLEG